MGCSPHSRMTLEHFRFKSSHPRDEVSESSIPDRLLIIDPALDSPALAHTRQLKEKYRFHHRDSEAQNLKIKSSGIS